MQNIEYLQIGSQIDTVFQNLTESRASLFNGKRVMLIQENTRHDVTLITQRKLQSVKFGLLPHPPYSPYLSFEPKIKSEFSSQIAEFFF